MLFFRKKYHQKTDEQLVQALVEGQQAAFNELYQRYYGRMKGYFKQMLGQHGRPEDFTQDLFLKVIEKAHYFNPKYRFSTWIYTIASNMCKNSYRSKKNKKIDYVEELETLDKVGRHMPDRLDKIQFNAHLEEALLELKPQHRECFILRYKEELSIKEIAAIMDIPDGTVKSRLFYVLRRLAKQLKIYKNVF